MILINFMATATSYAEKKNSLFLVKRPNSANRLIRAASVSAIRQHLLGEVKISKASGDDVATALQGDCEIENIALTPPTPNILLEESPQTGA